MVAWVAVWWLGWPFVRVRTREGRSRATSEKGTVLGRFRPQAPLGWLGGWWKAPRPCFGAWGDFWWLGWPRVALGGRSPVLPPVGRVKNARKTTAGALGKADRRSKRTNPQIRAACGAAPKEARISASACASREPRATSRVTRVGERRNPHPQEQQGRPHVRAGVRTRDVASAMTRSVTAARGACALIRLTYVTRPVRQDAQREGSGEPQPPRVRACVRTCARA